MLLHPRRTLAPAVLLVLLTALLLSAARAAAAPPPFSLTSQPGSVDFGLVGVDWGENGTTVAVQNGGPDTVQVSAATIDGSGANAFRVTNDGCNGQLLGSGATCYVNLGFDPSERLAYDATLHVPSDGGELTVSLAGLGGVQEVTPGPALLDFGAIDLGSSAARSFTLTNTGNLPYQSIVALPTGDDVGAFHVTQDGCSMQRLDPGDACTLVVRFAPVAIGAASAQLMVIGGNGTPLLLPLRGSGQQALAVLAPSSLDFGAQRRKHRGPVQTINVVNAGSGTLRIVAAAIGGLDAGQFRIVGESCTAAPLAPAGSCSVRVRFVPSGVGAAGATLRLLTNDATGVASAALSGRGLPAHVPGALRRRACLAAHRAVPARCRSLDRRMRGPRL